MSDEGLSLPMEVWPLVPVPWSRTPHAHTLSHLAEAHQVLEAAAIQRVALIGTKTTMAEPFYKMRLEKRGFEVVVPDEVGMDTVNRIIFEELCQGIFRDDSRKACRAVIADLVQKGAQGLILGCTEIGLLVKSEDAAVPLFDTTLIHAKGAALAAMD